jgi:hypothetical protein
MTAGDNEFNDRVFKKHGQRQVVEKIHGCAKSARDGATDQTVLRLCDRSTNKTELPI